MPLCISRAPGSLVSFSFLSLTYVWRKGEDNEVIVVGCGGVGGKKGSCSQKEKETGELGDWAWHGGTWARHFRRSRLQLTAFFSLSTQLRIASSLLRCRFSPVCYTPAHRVSLRPAFAVSKPKRFHAASHPVPHAALHPRCRDAAQMRSAWFGCIEALHLRVLVATTQRCVVERFLRCVVVTRRSCNANASTTTRSCKETKTRRWRRFPAAKLLEPPVYVSQGAQARGTQESACAYLTGYGPL